MFPGIKPSLATLAGNFRLPFFRDYLMSGGTYNCLVFCIQAFMYSLQADASSDTE